MEAGLLFLFVWAQIAFGLFFLTWLWVLRWRSAEWGTSDKQERLLWLAAISYTFGVAVDFYFVFAPRLAGPGLLARAPGFVSFLLGCVGAILALLGRGKGRVVTGVACCLLAMSWMPFILP